MLHAAKIKTYATDPLEFFSDLMIRANGVVRFGDVMVPFQRERFAALAPSLLAVANDRKPPVGKFWWEATKGFSKSSDMAAALLWLLGFTKRPIVAQVAAADAEQAAETRKASAELLRLNRLLDTRITVQNWRMLCKTTSATADIVASDVAGSHGARPDVVFVDELSHITKREFVENILDNSAKMPNALVCVATNAGFLGTWQQQWREIARTSERWCFSQWAEPAPWLDPADVEDARQRNSASRFMRLFHGVWSPNAGDAIDPALIEDAITLNGPMTTRLPGWGFVAGLDLGVTSDHAGFVVLGSEEASNRISLVDCQSWRPPAGGQIDLAAIENYVHRAHRKFNLRSLHYDPYQAVMMAQNLRRRNIRCEQMDFVGKNLNRMASALLDVFNSGSIDLYDEPELIRDLFRLTIVEKSYGYKLESTRDADGHADRATALAICLPAAIELAHHKAFIHRAPTCLTRFSEDPMSRGILVNTVRR